MKSLRESLFDDNITKDITFGDLYSYAGDSESSEGWRTWPLDKMYSIRKVIKKSGVKDPDKNVSVHDGILQIILGLKLEKSPDDFSFLKHVQDALDSETFDLYLSSFPGKYRCPRVTMNPGGSLNISFKGSMSYIFNKK